MELLGPDFLWPRPVIWGLSRGLQEVKILSVQNKDKGKHFHGSKWPNWGKMRSNQEKSFKNTKWLKLGENCGRTVFLLE